MGQPGTGSGLGRRRVLLIPVFEPSLRDLVFALHALEQRRDLGQRILRRQVRPVLLVAQRAIVLDVLARRLHGGHAEGSRGTFQEVTERGELLEILLLAMEERRVSDLRIGACKHGWGCLSGDNTYKAWSMSTKVVLAWVK